MRLYLLVLVACLTVGAAGTRECVAQMPAAGLPRALVDSTFAVRVELERIADVVRTGTVDTRDALDTTLAGAIRRLASVAAHRTVKRPTPIFGPFWDFQFDSVRVSAIGPDLRVDARAMLATSTNLSAPVWLTFRRQGPRWALVQHSGLVEQILMIATRIQNGEAP